MRLKILGIVPFMYLMRRRSLVACALWCSLVGGGFTWIARAGQASGAVAIAPARWPAGATLTRATDRPTLLVTLHPQCPCSQATVSELERLMRDRAGKVDLRVLFVRPKGLVDDPERSSLWERVASIPGARAQIDEGGVITAAFGAFTSGQVFLYDASGELLFSGGITASRAHEGDNAGRDAVESLLDRRNAPAHTPVFGCSLFGEKE
jgi:hypothetical protein